MRVRDRGTVPAGLSSLWRLNAERGTRAGTRRWGFVRRYSGGWKHGLRHGVGTCEYPDGETYSGDWAHDRRDGFGVTSFKDGDRHYGQWRADDREGPGVMEWADGDVFCGAYSAGLQHGTAVTIVPCGDKFAEEYLNGEERSSSPLVGAANPGALSALARAEAAKASLALFARCGSPLLFRAFDHPAVLVLLI